MFKKLLTASLALGVLAFPAGAGAYVNKQGVEVCPGQSFEQAFSQFGDKRMYTLVDNGSFENGLEGWQTTGFAGVVAHANEFRPEPGGNALLLAGGSSVISPAICVSKGYPSARAFVQKLSGKKGALNVEVLYPPKGKDKPVNHEHHGNGNANGHGNGNGHGSDTDTATDVQPPAAPSASYWVKRAGSLRAGSAFGPSRKFSIGQGRIGRGTAMVRFRFTVTGDATYLIDDLLVDPRCRS